MHTLCIRNLPSNLLVKSVGSLANRPAIEKLHARLHTLDSLYLLINAISGFIVYLYTKEFDFLAYTDIRLLIRLSESLRRRGTDISTTNMNQLRDALAQLFPIYQSQNPPQAPAISNCKSFRARIGAPPGSPRTDPTRRIVFDESTVSLRAWPSRGGLIVLECATSVDFDFLGLDPLKPVLRRSSSQSAEDDFCKQLLLLGAKWWDSESRYGFIRRLDLDPNAVMDLEEDREPWPTLRERRWVKVGWPSHPQGALWVAEFDTNLPGIEEEDNLLPVDAALVILARNMDER